ncbi:MAG: zinc ribbon domain-containing protein [Actinomycetota bacterium]|nr:zinc ribbon domain-containing protein [Actinomycetota bacterium]
MIVCKACGYKNEDGSGFCGSCGSFLEWTGERVDNEDVLPSVAHGADRSVGALEVDAPDAVRLKAVMVDDDPEDTRHLEEGSSVAAQFASTHDTHDDHQPSIGSTSAEVADSSNGSSVVVEPKKAPSVAAARRRGRPRGGSTPQSSQDSEVSSAIPSPELEVDIPKEALPDENKTFEIPFLPLIERGPLVVGLQDEQSTTSNSLVATNLENNDSNSSTQAVEVGGESPDSGLVVDNEPPVEVNSDVAEKLFAAPATTGNEEVTAVTSSSDQSPEASYGETSRPTPNFMDNIAFDDGDETGGSTSVIQSPVAPASSTKPRRRSGSVRKQTPAATISTTAPDDARRIFEGQRRSIKDGIACFNCGTLNERSRYYCHHCAFVLPPPPPPQPPLTRWQRFVRWVKAFFAKLFYTRPDTAEAGERLGKSWRSQRDDSSNETPWQRLKSVGQRFFGAAVMLAMVLAYLGPLRSPINNYYTRFKTDIQKRLQLQYVSVYAVNAAATSSLPALPPKNVIDGLSNTYWAAQPTPTSGVGQVLTMTFSPSTHLDKIGFIIGADDTAADYTSQPRPAEVTVTYDGKSHSTFSLVDSASFQSFTIHKLGVTKVSIRIDSVYKSPVGKSVSIAEVLFYKLA